jgi:hypothetical protein
MGQLPFTLWLVLSLGQAAQLDARMVQVAPEAAAAQAPSRRAARAVVVLQGLHLPVSLRSTGIARLSSYQLPQSRLVQRLAQDSDVFAFAYSQNIPVTDAGLEARLCHELGCLRGQGYAEIVLVGFSAGGLIARQLIEDVPQVGVTKVIQVCSPNIGSVWALAHGADPFIESLTRKARAVFLGRRSAKRIPDPVQFVCVVGTRLGQSDGVVSVRSQWPQDLEEQGVPMRAVHAGHLQAARSSAGVELIAELVRENQPRQYVTPGPRTHLRLPPLLFPSTKLGVRDN